MFKIAAFVLVLATSAASGNEPNSWAQQLRDRVMSLQPVETLPLGKSDTNYKFSHHILAVVMPDNPPSEINVTIYRNVLTFVEVPDDKIGFLTVKLRNGDVYHIGSIFDPERVQD